MLPSILFTTERREWSYVHTTSFCRGASKGLISQLHHNTYRSNMHGKVCSMHWRVCCMVYTVQQPHPILNVTSDVYLNEDEPNANNWKLDKREFKWRIKCIKLSVSQRYLLFVSMCVCGCPCVWVSLNFFFLLSTFRLFKLDTLNDLMRFENLTQYDAVCALTFCYSFSSFFIDHKRERDRTNK